MDINDWPFDQPPNAAAITLKPIAFEEHPILYVTHDADDHGWQFLGAGDVNPEQAAVVAMHNIVKLDPTVLELGDMPPGWHAWRKTKNSPWQRAAVMDS